MLPHSHLLRTNCILYHHPPLPLLKSIVARICDRNSTAALCWQLIWFTPSAFWRVFGVSFIFRPLNTRIPGNMLTHTLDTHMYIFFFSFGRAVLRRPDAPVDVSILPMRPIEFTRYTPPPWPFRVVCWRIFPHTYIHTNKSSVFVYAHMGPLCTRLSTPFSKLPRLFFFVGWSSTTQHLDFIELSNILLLGTWSLSCGTGRSL